VLQISYILDGTGWATVTMSAGDHEIAMTASYLHDSLAELAQAAIDVRDGQSCASVVFMDEPGEHLMLIQADAPGHLHVELRQFEDWASWGMFPRDRYRTVFEARCDVREFVDAVTRVLDEVLTEWGLDGYRRKWVEHEFPVEQHRTLAGG
jgi:hypothetical protein